MPPHIGFLFRHAKNPEYFWHYSEMKSVTPQGNYIIKP